MLLQFSRALVDFNRPSQNSGRVKSKHSPAEQVIDISTLQNECSLPDIGPALGIGVNEGLFHYSGRDMFKVEKLVLNP